ncbi:MAG: S9 family peptidase [Opitutae bacterium]|nr:S9 family peptidase [Opitutae bacterium]
MNRHFGRATLCGLAGLALLACAEARADAEKSTGAAAVPPPLLPVEDFARPPDITAAKLSPDGKHLGYLFAREKRLELGIMPLETERARSFSYGYWPVVGFDWLSSERLLIWEGGLAAINRNFSMMTGLTGWIRHETQRGDANYLWTDEVLGHRGPDKQRILINDFDHKGWGKKAEWFPNVLEMDASSAMFRTYILNPGRVAQWLQGWDGEVRFGVVKGEKVEDPYQLIQRDGPGQPWRKRELGERARHFWISGISADGGTLYVSREGPTRRWELAELDLKTGAVAEAPLFRAGDYDLTPPEWMPVFAGETLAKPIFSEGYQRLLGVRYVTDGPHEYWFNPDLENIQKQIQQMHPDHVNLIVSMDDAVKRLLVLSYSAREPGLYTLVDLETGKVRVLARRCPWIKPEHMADTYPVACTARDGLALHGYLTLPTGRPQRDLPMVTLVHGGPWVRDVWGYDPIVQFLANRGYAVLQVNYRGSSGYGAEFLDQGAKEIGGKIQDDITDMTGWVVKQGIADPRRLAIMGASYGGYSTLFALAQTPAMYRCGISFAGVADWPLLWKSRADDAAKESYYYWSKRIGDMEDPAVQQRLAAVSPVHMAGQMTAPLLLIHGKADNTVPFEHSEAMAAALTKAGRPPQTLYLNEVGHWIPSHEKGVKFYQAIERFLAQHLKAP